MEVVIRIALMFFFIQFLVVMTMMAVTLLLARPEGPFLGRESGREAIRRSFAFLTHVPSQVFGFMVRLMRFLHFLPGTH